MTELLTEQTLGEFTKKGVVLIDIFAPWCGPCQNMLPVVDTLADDYKGKVSIGKINMDECIEYIQQNFFVDAIPTFILYKDGIEMFRHTGAIAEDSLRLKIESLTD